MRPGMPVWGGAGGQRSMPDLFFNHCPSCSLRQSPSETGAGIFNQTDWAVSPWDCPVFTPFPQVLGLWLYITVSGFSMGAGDSSQVLMLMMSELC